MSGNGKRYNEYFKEMIVELYQTGSSVADLSREYGVTNFTIYKWIKQYSEIKIDENTTITKKEMLEIQKENKKLKEELAILKKLYPYSRTNKLTIIK